MRTSRVRAALGVALCALALGCEGGSEPARAFLFVWDPVHGYLPECGNPDDDSCWSHPIPATARMVAQLAGGPNGFALKSGARWLGSDAGDPLDQRGYDELAAALGERPRSYDVLIFGNTCPSRLALAAAAKRALMDFLSDGGGVVGVHCANDSNIGTSGGDLDDYREQLLGGLVWSDFPVASTHARRADAVHPATEERTLGWSGDSDPRVVTDEIYNFRAHPAGRLHLLLDAPVTGSVQFQITTGPWNTPHPLSFCRQGLPRRSGVEQAGGGRAFFTVLGHGRDNYPDGAHPIAWFAEHLRTGILYAARRSGSEGACPDDNPPISGP